MSQENSELLHVKLRCFVFLLRLYHDQMKSHCFGPQLEIAYHGRKVGEGAGCCCGLRCQLNGALDCECQSVLGYDYHDVQGDALHCDAHLDGVQSDGALHCADAHGVQGGGAHHDHDDGYQSDGFRLDGDHDGDQLDGVQLDDDVTGVQDDGD